MRTTRIRRPRLSYSNVAATLALVIAASMGGAYGHGKVGPNLIKNNAVKSRHIGWQQVKTGDIAKRSVATNRLKPRAVTRGKLAPNARSTVIRYPLGAHDFSTADVVCGTIPRLTDAQIARSQWQSTMRTAGVDDETFTDSTEGYGMTTFVHNAPSSTEVCVSDVDDIDWSVDNVFVFRTVQNRTSVPTTVGRDKPRPRS